MQGKIDNNAQKEEDPTHPSERRRAVLLPGFRKIESKKIRRRMVTSVELHCRMTNRVYDTLINDGFGFEG